MRKRTRSSCALRLSQRQYDALLQHSYTELLRRLGTPTRNTNRTWPRPTKRPKTGVIIMICSVTKEFLHALVEATKTSGKRLSEEFRDRLLALAGIEGADSPARNRRGRKLHASSQDVLYQRIHLSFMQEDPESRWPTHIRLQKWTDGRKSSADSTRSTSEI